MVLWPDFARAMNHAARAAAHARPLGSRARVVGPGWDHPNNSTKLFELEESMRTHICVVAQQPLFTMPIKWAEQLPPDMLDRLKAVYEEMVRANGHSGCWAQFNVQNLVLCICIRLAFTQQMANFKEAHVAEAMGFEQPHRCTFGHTRDHFFVYLQSPPPIGPADVMQMLPPPGPAMPSPALEMLGVHTLTALQAPPPQEPPPLMWTIDEVMATVIELEDAGQLDQLREELRLAQFASLATMR